MPLHTDPSASTFDALLVRYVDGAIAPHERAQVEAWLAEHPDHRTALRELMLVREATRQLPERFDTDAGWLAARHRLHQRNTSSRIPIPRWRFLVLGGVLTAASAVLVLVFGLGTHRSPGVVYATATGQRLSVTLVDGTRVMLAPESRLRVPRTFGTGAREVMLEGEGYFTVIHDAAHPFSVLAGHARTRDVGTAFDVRAYPRDEDARVAVTDGEVVVDHDDCRVGAAPCGATLRRGDVAIVGVSEVALRRNVDVASYTIWMQGGLSFDDTRLADAIRDVSRTFGVKILLADSTLAAKRVTGRFTDQSLDVVMDVITRAVGAQYQRTGQTVVIRQGAGKADRGQANTSPAPLKTAEAEGLRK